MEYGSYEILLGFSVLFLAVYYYLTSTFDYWRSQAIPGPEPRILFGNLKDVIFGKISLGGYLTKQYEKFKNEPMIGIFVRRMPVLILHDPDYIKDVLIKDFSIFADRGMIFHEKIEPLSQHLFMLEPERWRPLRAKLSPTFTSGKLKEMFYLLIECADHFEEVLNDCIAKNSVIECRELTARFTTDAIGVCAFGLKMNALSEEDNQFRKIGRQLFATDGLKSLKMKLREGAPWLYKLLGPLMYDYEINDFFIGLFKDTVEYRKKNNVKKNDFVDLLMEIKENPNKVKDIELNDAFLTAQLFVFFIAGFETSSTTMSNFLYELALNQPIQNKLREEVNNELNKNNGNVKYDTIKNLKYMHKVYSETLRKYPPLMVIMRRSTESYTFSGSKLTIPKGMRVWIPVYAIQRDPQIYPNPDTFDPERFDDEISKHRNLSFYLPFGAGPRNCIAARFANYQSKVGLIKILSKYKVDVCDETCVPYVIHPRSFLLTPTEGIKLKFTKIT
ncbi:cytochrome P450 6A1-like isoform X2 [Phymastichus coffea]|nr:cytochrome P450 6A1-like isoform X2 [Phymastichus coffea]XP_058794278.1 cytochrome P450 6A1-like isoform X2 [Phymastichus coffea]XP_058794279.1 cytochrome P450 6A1-like isoform X2 [Phymastichus coffea]